MGKIADLPRTAIDSIPLGGMGIPMIFLSMLEKGKDAYLPAGTKFTAYLNGDVALDRVALERVQPAPAQHTGPATVTVFGLGGASGFHPPVYCGKIALAKLPGSAYLKIQLPPGKYFFRSSDAQVVEVRLEGGQELYLGIQMVFFHKRGLKGRLVQVDDEEGEYTIARFHFRQLADKDVTKVSDANLAELKAPPELK